MLQKQQKHKISKLILNIKFGAHTHTSIV